jgi:hypothetical protein
MIRLSRQGLAIVAYIACCSAALHVLVTYRLVQYRSALGAALMTTAEGTSPEAVSMVIARARADYDALPTGEGGRVLAAQTLSRIAAWMDGANVTDRSLGLESPQATHGFLLIPMNLTFSCPSETCLDLLRELQAEAGDIRVSRLRVRATESSEAPSVTVLLRLEMICRAEGAG